jgi:hypothetical protein
VYSYTVRGVIPFADRYERLGIAVQLVPLSRDACTKNAVVAGVVPPGWNASCTRLLVTSNTAVFSTAAGGGLAGVARRVQVVEETAVGKEPGPDHCENACT